MGQGQLKRCSGEAPPGEKHWVCWGEKHNWQAGTEGKVWMWQRAGKRRVMPAPTIKARSQLAVRAAGRRPNNKAASEC